MNDSLEAGFNIVKLMYICVVVNLICAPFTLQLHSPMTNDQQFNLHHIAQDKYNGKETWLEIKKLNMNSKHVMLVYLRFMLVGEGEDLRIQVLEGNFL